MVSVKMHYVNMSFYLKHGDNETKDIIYGYVNAFDETKSEESYIFNQDTLRSCKTI